MARSLYVEIDCNFKRCLNLAPTQDTVSVCEGHERPVEIYFSASSGSVPTFPQVTPYFIRRAIKRCSVVVPVCVQPTGSDIELVAPLR